MATSHLNAVPDDGSGGAIVELGRGAGPDSAVRRIRQLQREARELAHEQTEAFARDLQAMAERAAEIAAGGEVYAVGAREIAARLADDLAQKAQLIATIASRTR